VSFYNETPEHAIYPTPTIGMVGLIEPAGNRVTMDFKADGDGVFLVSLGEPTFGGSEYLSRIHGREVGAPPALNLENEKRVQGFVREAIAQGLLQTAHDISDGGLAVALAESAIAGCKGAEIALDTTAPALALYGERTASIVVTAMGDKLAALQALAQAQNVPLVKIGTVGGERLLIQASGKSLIDAPVRELAEAFETAIPRAMGEK
jgi:phosphoribosylformylglycinamidine synthase